MTRLMAIIRKEFIQMRRDRMTFVTMLAVPVIQLIMFGFAINTDVKHLPTVVFDQCRQEESRELLAAFSSSQYFHLEETAQSFAQVEGAIQSGRAKVGIVFAPDYAENIKHGRPGSVQVLVDATDSMSAASAISAAQMIGQIRSQDILVRRIQAQGGSFTGAPIDVRVRSWYNPDFITAWYMVPGILCIILTMTMVMMTSMAIVRERENGTLEQLIVTPLKTWELMVGKIIPYIFVGLIQMTLTLIVGILIFAVPLEGSLLLLYALTMLFILASLSLGILISTIARTQMQAMQMSFFMFLPSVLLSGYMFPREAMPEIFYYLGYALPITFQLQIFRGIMLKGIGLYYLLPQVFALSVYIIVVMAIALTKFQKKIA